MSTVVPAKRVTIQGGRSLDVEAGRTYHVVTRSNEFGNKEWTEELESVQTLNPGEGREFDFLHFKGHGARDFTIAELTEVTDITPSWADILPVLMGVAMNPEAPVTAHRQVQANLTLMAELADRYIMLVKNGSGDLTGLTPVLTDPDAAEGRA